MSDIEKCRGCGQQVGTVVGLDVEGLGRMHYSCEVKRLNNLIEEMQPDETAKAGPGPERKVPPPEYLYHYSGIMALPKKTGAQHISGVLQVDEKITNHEQYVEFLKILTTARKIDPKEPIVVTSLTLLSEKI